jgi:hypothetical protein
MNHSQSLRVSLISTEFTLLHAIYKYQHSRRFVVIACRSCQLLLSVYNMPLSVANLLLHPPSLFHVDLSFHSLGSSLPYQPLPVSCASLCTSTGNETGPMADEYFSI